ncbi:IclR family transcriptional regulator [Niallia sp. Krafla_26]|uniref:IclR family transcriptional regulator n=1 Tax=Niallia sp. Krafla_26 TaxID=3064703 RepID=UPI003D1845C4
MQSVQNGLKILNLFKTTKKTVMGTTEIAKNLDLPKSSVSRLLETLCQEGYLEKIGVKYRLGFSLLNLSGLIKYHMEIQRVALEPFQKLVEKSGESAVVSVLEGARVIYILKQVCKEYFQIRGDIGKGNPAFCSSSGKILLAHIPEKMVDDILKYGMPKMGPNSLTEPGILKSQLLEIKERGYSICIDEMHDDVISIAAPIRDYSESVVSAITLIGPKQRMMDKSITEMVDLVVKTAEEISSLLGYINFSTAR